MSPLRQISTRSGSLLLHTGPANSSLCLEPLPLTYVIGLTIVQPVRRSVFIRYSYQMPFLDNFPRDLTVESRSEYEYNLITVGSFSNRGFPWTTLKANRSHYRTRQIHPSQHTKIGFSIFASGSSRRKCVSSLPKKNGWQTGKRIGKNSLPALMGLVCR